MNDNACYRTLCNALLFVSYRMLPKQRPNLIGDSSLTSTAMIQKKMFLKQSTCIVYALLVFNAIKYFFHNSLFIYFLII